LRPRKPAGAMYMMVGIDLEKFPDIKTDLEFVQLLIKQKSVFCLPASVSLLKFRRNNLIL
jgi:tyrosine aminotransferase